MSIRSRILFLIGVIVLANLSPGTLFADEKPYEINVITSLTGRGAQLGKQTTEALQILETITNQQGGVGGRPIKFVITDDQTNAQSAVSLATATIARNVPVILGPYMTANCKAVYPLVQRGPVMWCFSPSFRPTKNSYGFTSNASSDGQFRVAVRYLHSMGINRVAMITAGDAAGQEGEETLDAAVASPEVRGMTVVAHEHFGESDLSVAAQISRIKAAGAQAIFVWVTGTPLGTVLQGLAQAGFDVPVVTTNGNADVNLLKSYAAYVPQSLLIPGMFYQVPDQVPPGAVKVRIAQYYDAFKKNFGEVPGSGAGIVWDAASIVIDALKKLGPDATASDVHNYLEKLHGWIGLNGTYDFRDGSQRGLGDGNIIMISWNAKENRFVAASRAGGIPPK